MNVIMLTTKEFRLTGPQTIDGKQVYLHYLRGKPGFSTILLTIVTFTVRTEIVLILGANRYVQIRDNWYYVGNDGKILTSEHIIDGAHVYFEYGGKQVKGDFDYKINFTIKTLGLWLLIVSLPLIIRPTSLGQIVRLLKERRHRQH